MPTITLREDQPTESGFTAILEFDHRIRFSVTVSDPFQQGEEKQLEWYFEEWLRFPIVDTVKARETAKSIENYGTSLFEQIFRSNPDAYTEYSKLKGNLAQLRIEIEGNNPEFQALHWEALRDPNLPRPLAVDCVMVRKSTRGTAVAAEVAASATINLLLVTARPSKNDVAYRTISRPLIELIENSRLRVNLELLRPGTFEALEKHLEAKGTGYYHIIHFDTHGALLSYQQFDRSQSPESTLLMYRERYGREPMEPYEGVKAFLVLEGEEEGRADLVEATEMANLLTNKGIPVCILNACQSGKQLGGEEGQEEDYRETSLGSRLMSAGMQMVVAMGYSVTVSATEIVIAELYRALFSGQPIDEAIRLGRRELFNRKERRAYFNETIRLEDWLLPVVYSNQPVNFNLREFSLQEEEAYFEALAGEFRFKQPEYKFVGRDLDILRVERGLLRQNILLLQGMGGTGKTTLLSYLREWWQKTGFAEKIFYFGYDERAWTLEQILFDLGGKIYDRFEMARFQAMTPGAQMQKMVMLLRAANHVLILDNLESVTGEPLAIPNTLEPGEREKIRDFLSRLSGGKTRVVLGSRGAEEWLKDTTFKNNVYPLRGLDEQARTELAKRILGSRGEELQGQPDFMRLMRVLAGYPLAMEVVLPNLKRQSPGQVLEALRVADGDLDTYSEDRTKSIIKCVEYSHGNLSENSQKLLLCLAPFSGFIDRSDIPNYAQQLQKLEPLQGYNFADFDRAIQEAIDWGLLEPMDEENRLLTIQPVFPYFLKTKLNGLDVATREAIGEGFKNHYLGLAGSYNQLIESKDPQERQLGIFFCRLEYENLYNALQTCLANRESISIFFCLWKYLDVISDIQSNLKLSKFVCEAQESYPPEIRTGEIGQEIVLALSRLANCYLQTKDYQKARKAYQETVQLYQNLSAIQERQRQLWIAINYHQLGRVAVELREYEEARRNYQLALAIKVEFGDRYEQALTYHQLGIVAQELREYEEARRNYQLALDIYVEFGDRYEQSGTYGQLGIVAVELREYEEARRNYQLALDIYVEFGDRYGQASTYHNLGSVAEGLREYEEARRNYQLALDIYVEFGDRYEQASTYHNLGIVAEGLREYEEARRNYQLALDIYVEFGDRYEQAKTYHQLGIVAEELGELEEAKINFLQAGQIWAQFNDEYNVQTFSIPSLALLYETTKDESLLEAIAEVSGVGGEDTLPSNEVLVNYYGWEDVPSLNRINVNKYKKSIIVPPIIVPIFFATDRKTQDTESVTTFYGGERNLTGELEWGKAYVSIPVDHTMGVIERPEWWKLEFFEDIEKHIVLLNDIRVFDQTSFENTFRRSVANSQEATILVFIHGYNTSFADAAMRTAQIAYDLQFQGQTILYSWPSEAKFESYTADENNIEWTIGHFEEFLNILLTKVGATTVNTIAHSMGNRILTRAIHDLDYTNLPEPKATLHNVIFAAPDIDADTFKRFAKKFKEKADRLTLYASSKDKALKASKLFHGGYPRAGDSGKNLVIVDGLDTIDASLVDTSLLGHSYFGDNRSILSDIFYLIKHNLPPDRRSGLKQKTIQNLYYWLFQR